MFLNRLTELMKKNNLTKASLARLSGIPYTTIDGFFKKGYENTKLSTLKQLSVFFNVSLDYLVAQDNITDNIILTDKYEKCLIENYRNLSEQGKEYILQTMELVKNKYTKPKVNTGLEEKKTSKINSVAFAVAQGSGLQTSKPLTSEDEEKLQELSKGLKKNKV